MGSWKGGTIVKKTLLKNAIWLMLLVPFCASSQNSDTIHFSLKMANEPLILHKNYYLTNDTLRLESVRFYVSNITLLSQHKIINKVDGRCFLVDAETDTSLVISLPVGKTQQFDEIQLDLGIDSAVNVAGVQGGALDPVTGMYWSWQSGYINAKIEGWSPKSSARKQEFQYHLGGYLAPYEARKTMHFNLVKPASSVTIEVQLDDFFKHVDLANKPMVMSPGEVAKSLSGHLSNCFRLVQ